MTSSQSLSQEQLAARDAMAALLRDLPAADRRYDALAASRDGRIVSTDIARFLDVRYAGVSPGQPRDLAPGWDLAWRYAQGRLERELQDRRKRPTIRFMAGGWAAGKTHAVENMPSADLTWDGTMRSRAWNDRMISMALSCGWNVEIAYVHRDLELALYGALERGRTEGRSVPLTELPLVHREVQQAIRGLYRAYHRHSKVSFMLLHNLGSGRLKIPPLPIEISSLAPRAPLHYGKSHERYFSEAADHLAQSGAQIQE